MRYRIGIRILLLLLAASALLLVTRVTTLHPAHAYPAADFTLSDLNGNPVHLSALRGKAVVLNFWASWCGPCRAEIPCFNDMQREYGPQGLQVIGVSMDDGGRDEIKRSVQRMNVEYTVLVGDAHVASMYGAEEILPTTYYISRDGKVVALAKGVISKREVESNIKDALAVPRTPTGK